MMTLVSYIDKGLCSLPHGKEVYQAPSDGLLFNQARAGKTGVR
ncbi:hypothetical protein [Thermosporothrix hazakensis]|nr:hypothetical protein [Thermosporothrix hazakensis]